MPKRAWTREKALASLTRAKLYAAIQAMPGINCPQLAERTGVRGGALGYNLEVLVAAGVVVARGRYRREYYAVASPAGQSPLQGNARRIGLALVAGHETVLDIAIAVGLSERATYRYVKSFVTRGLVTSTREGVVSRRGGRAPRRLAPTPALLEALKVPAAEGSPKS